MQLSTFFLTNGKPEDAGVDDLVFEITEIWKTNDNRGDSSNCQGRIVDVKSVHTWQAGYHSTHDPADGVGDPYCRH